MSVMARSKASDQVRTSQVLSIFQRVPFYLCRAASGTKWLSLHFINLLTDDYRQCSCLKSSRRACKHQNWKAARSCLVHVPALSLTAFVLFINFSQTYWENVGAPTQNVRLNLLQLAGKVLEMLVVTSLSCVVVNHIQYELLHGSGLSLGIVLAGFQATTLTSIFNPSLWKKLSARGSRKRRYRFIILLVLLVILCAVVGPSCAILILPSIDWWPDKSATFSENRFYINANKSVLWPTHVTVEDTFFPPACGQPNATFVEYCPASGLSAIRDSVSSGLTVHWPGQLVNTTLPLKLEIPPPKFHRAIQTFYTTYPNYNYSDLDAMYNSSIITFIGASNSIMIENMLAKLMYYEQSLVPRVYDNNRVEILFHDAKRTFIPRVLTQCTMKEELAHIPLADSPLFFPSNLPGVNWTVDVGAYLGDSQNASVWVNSHDMGGAATIPSIAMVANYTYSGRGAQYETGPYSVFLACSVYASWEPVTLYLNIGSRSFHSPDFPGLVSCNDPGGPNIDPNIFKVQNMFNPASAGSKPILIDVDWANLMLPPNETIELLRQTMEDYGPATRTPEVITFVPAVSLLLIDALARIGMSTTTTLGSSKMFPRTVVNDNFRVFDGAAEISSINLQKSTELVIRLSRFGYGYSAGGTTRYIAIGILLAYIAITTIHIVFVLWYSWSCTDLDSLYDLVNLAVSSSRDLPDDVVSFGLAELKKQNVNVKAEERADSELRMVLNSYSVRDSVDDPEGLVRQRKKTIGNYFTVLKSKLGDGSESQLSSKTTREEK
ncbi:hypothetical protein HYFRA_00008380 [Hymenoscyphus fraxineus]|uniref:Uncharacterized protein n=1 Tax=Hymenoscyphus fraxineus TaxID=746836 RepID=A0A9N9KQA6_9HELO|nr:hypothetical protein HYFRA_00008380 [Hymenoscyphus fraxineus]